MVGSSTGRQAVEDMHGKVAGQAYTRTTAWPWAEVARACDAIAEGFIGSPVTLWAPQSRT